MTSQEIIDEFGNVFDKSLAIDLVHEFLEIKKDFQTQTFSRASSGKFVETIVQILEFLETGRFTSPPAVDNYLKNLESRSTSLSDDLRICTARIARSLYTLRNKRNILHKGMVDPNLYDLKYIYASSQWIMTELVRNFISSDVTKAEEIIEFIQVPVNQFSEKINNQILIHAKCTVADEICLLLYTVYPEYLILRDINLSLERRAKSSVSNAIKKLWLEKTIHKDIHGCKLTQAGFIYSQDLLKRVI